MAPRSLCEINQTLDEILQSFAGDAPELSTLATQFARLQPLLSAAPAAVDSAWASGQHQPCDHYCQCLVELQERLAALQPRLLRERERNSAVRAHLNAAADWTRAMQATT